jgi:hypothetical protein
LPEGANPDTFTVRGPAGLLLSTVRVATLAPKLVGANRMGNGRDVPGAIVIGHARASGTTKSPSEDDIPVTVSVHSPLSLRIKGPSTNEPTQTLPKSPAFARISASFGASALPEMFTIGGLAGSLLVISIVPNCGPKLAGRNRRRFRRDLFKSASFPSSFDPSPSQSLGYVAQMLEAGVQVVYFYIVDAHDNHVSSTQFTN